MGKGMLRLLPGLGKLGKELFINKNVTLLIDF